MSEAALRQFDAFSTPGSLLRAAREAQGMSEREAADRLNLMPGYVGILERDEYQSLRSPPFARGYVKSYGRLLGLDERQLMALFDEQWAGRRLPVSSGFTGRPAPLQRTGVGVVVSLVVLLLLVLALWWWRGATPENPAAESAGHFDRAVGTELSFAQAGE